MSKLPQPANLVEGLKNLDEKLVTQDHINSLLRIYPTDSIEGLLEENRNAPDEKWDKGEEYFIAVCTNESIRAIKQRLIAWQFKNDFPEKRENVVSV